VLIVLVFAGIRVATDWPHILAGTSPDDDFAQRYVAHPWLAYLHIAPGVVYLLGVPFQLSRRFRTRHYAVHRRLGRLLLACALLSGAMTLGFGVPFAWGGSGESAAAALFGAWFITCLVVAFHAIRRGDVRRHRRFMVRAFAVGLGVGTIRLWVRLFTGIQMSANGGPDGITLPDPDTFALSFWFGLTTHVLVGDWWLRRSPDLDV
jgi:uncharacterized membrane protein